MSTRFNKPTFEEFEAALPEVEKKIGNTVIYLEDLTSRLYADKDLQALGTWWAIKNGADRLMEAKGWLIPVLNALQKERIEKTKPNGAANGHAVPKVSK